MSVYLATSRDLPNPRNEAPSNELRVDIGSGMVARAREKHPGHIFHHVAEDDYSALGDETFDLVLVLGILHLHETWRDTVRVAWKHTAGHLILDLRETHGESIEDKARSYMTMDFNGGGEEHARAAIPYNVINAGQALAALTEICGDDAEVSQYGYLHPVSSAAHCPVERVMANTYCIGRPKGG